MQRLNVVAKGLSLLLGGLHPKVRHLRKQTTCCMPAELHPLGHAPAAGRYLLKRGLLETCSAASECGMSRGFNLVERDAVP